MAVLLPRIPTWLQTKGYSARDDRAVFTIAGTGVFQGLAVSAGPGMGVTVGPGLAVVPGTRSAGQGNYSVSLDASVVVPWPAASASQRVDTLYIQVLDNAEILTAGGAPVPTEGAFLNVAQGTTTVPADSLAIASVTVPALASSIVAGNIASVIRRVPAIPYSGALPTPTQDGQETYYNPPGYDVIWHLRWVQSQGHWYFLGGASMYDFYQGGILLGSSFASHPPVLTLPRAGLYQIEWGYSAGSHVVPGSASAYIVGPGGILGNEPICDIMCDQIDVIQAASATGQYSYTSGGSVGIFARGFAGSATVSAYRRWVRITPAYIT